MLKLPFSGALLWLAAAAAAVATASSSAAAASGRAPARRRVDWGDVGAAVERAARGSALLEPDPAAFYPLLRDPANRVRAGEPFARIARLNDTTFEAFAAYVRRGQPE
jgi:hypothetical protein